MHDAGISTSHSYEVPLEQNGTTRVLVHSNFGLVAGGRNENQWKIPGSGAKDILRWDGWMDE
jgi:hypothetical protein